ncbi:PD-(D/E)XK nuclease family protein [Limnohabitans sp. TEGF004]|jgi:hypothetical protein|uniref:PD-(D/E)XK nuclease family protein n=1 Tax=Limnohabitans sp. TEGF004 TaxID=2986281 RepID=UPI001B5F4452|nr:PD-(D/E)XK nuclease family protein [Limnohabitans sp. TEGF004]MBP7856112.1 PD-(D/E)XK nuclease family protein [Candidatus Methylopumilus sp.]BDU54809.1 hypothetical protein LTEGF4_04900 [Limnohabitans sp. TEGF004]
MRAHEDVINFENILSPKFLELDRLLKGFNIFNATDMKRREVKHTKFLAHLLNPNESHGLGVKFLENFLVYLSEEGSVTIDLLSLDLINAEVYSEKALESKESKGKTIDLLLLIPNLFGSDRHTLIAIEAKVESKGSNEQLNKYRELIEEDNGVFKDFTKHYYYLTVSNNEELEADNWNPVSFADVVVPAINVILKSYGDTISDYILAILNDYKEVMEESSSVIDAIDDIVESIELGVREKIKNLNPNANFRSRERLLQNKYFAAIDFLKKYDSDPRVKTESKFKEIVSFTALKHETSSRTFLRFSGWDKDNQIFLKGISNGENDKWLESNEHLAFEFRQDLSDLDSQKIDISLRLVLGPTKDSFLKRNELHLLLSNVGDEILTANMPLQAVQINKKTNIGGRWAGVINSKKLKNFSRKGLGVNEALAFVKDCLQNSEMIELISIINLALHDFRENEQ